MAKAGTRRRYGHITVTVRGPRVKQGKRISWNGGWRLVGPDGRVFKVKTVYTMPGDHGSRYFLLRRPGPAGK